MIDVKQLYQAKLRNFGVSAGDSKFQSDCLMAFNMVVNDLTTRLEQTLPYAQTLDDQLDINLSHWNTFMEGLDHYLTSQFEWTHQNKRDTAMFYEKALRSSHTAAMQETTIYGRLGNHQSVSSTYPPEDQNVFLHLTGAENGPIEPVPFG